MISRHHSRKAALDMLYEADLRDRPLPLVLADRIAGDEPPSEFTLQLVRGVHRHRTQIDDLISANARDWTMPRMPIVDRNILRIGVYEILHVDDVPTAVAIDEAVQLAKELSTDDSGRFVNGLLAGVAAQPAAVRPAGDPDGSSGQPLRVGEGEPDESVVPPGHLVDDEG